MLSYTTDIARPGFVTFYDIWRGNGAGLFLQPRNPHGAERSKEFCYLTNGCICITDVFSIVELKKCVLGAFSKVVHRVS